STIDDISQLLVRLTEQDKLTRQEFEMLSKRMPGLSSAVQEQMDVGSEAMYEMLRNGEITSDDFIDIMEGFSGEMAKEYAKTWDGMIDNTKAFIGILGENLLGGVFEKSKESLREFINVLSSETAQQKAAEIGDKLEVAFTKVVEKVKDVINWFRNLSEGQQQLIMKVGAFAVALGPLLTGFGI